MTTIFKLIFISSLLVIIQCNSYDDGKYNPQKYSVYDDGRYYRPPDEGKYVHDDEGKYTYIYRQGLYPDDDGDYRYIHQVGPNGGFGGNGGYGGKGGVGGEGGFGPDGPKGPRGPNSIEYIGRKVYAEKYPYLNKFIKQLVDKYVSKDYINFGDTSEGSANHYKKVFADEEVAVKCEYLTPQPNNTSFVTQYPPRLQLEEGEQLRSYYSFKGTKVLTSASDQASNNLKLQYEVYVKVVNN